MSKVDNFTKRLFDVFFSLLGLLILWPLIGVTIIIAGLSTGKSGLFRQERLGRMAKPFTIYKLRTMSSEGGSTITASNDTRITPIGRELRRWKLDELPQLWNVLKGDMSFVGPRPDVAGFLDQIGDEWSEVLQLRPGITGPATLHYRNEEELLANVSDPIAHNVSEIWPHKLTMNRDYYRNWSLLLDVKYILNTVF